MGIWGKIVGYHKMAKPATAIFLANSEFRTNMWIELHPHISTELVKRGALSLHLGINSWLKCLRINDAN
jgi:hypothetical protein